MNLGKYIETLEKIEDKSRRLSKGLGDPDSWRSSYNENVLTFDIVENITIQEMLDCAKECIGISFTGYNGGYYIFNESTPINIDSYGRWTNGEKMWLFLLELLLTK
jgi:hypothetical protein